MGERIGKPVVETTSVPRVPHRNLPTPKEEPTKHPETPVKEPEREPVPVSRVREKVETLRALTRRHRMRYTRH